MKVTPNNISIMKSYISDLDAQAISKKSIDKKITITIGSSQLEIPFNADTSDWIKKCLDDQILKESMLHDFLPNEFKKSVLDYVFIDDICEFTVVDKKHDVIFFLEYNKGVLVGLDFYMDANDTTVQFNGSNIHLTEIYNRLDAHHGNSMSDYKKIHKAFDLYFSAFINIDEANGNFNLLKSDIDLLKKSLKNRIDVIGESRAIHDDNLNSERYDCFGLLGMLEECDWVNIEIPKDRIENWSAKMHNVDFPSPYSEQ